MKFLPLALLALLAPTLALAAGGQGSSFVADKNLVYASSSPANAYFAGGTLAVTAPVAGDLTALGGTLLLTAPVAGDALLLGGSVDGQGAVGGDLRALGARVLVEAPVAGDLVALAGSFTDTGGGARDAFILALEATLSAGAKGPVTIYANNVALGGDFAGDVRVVAAGRVALAENTHIAGSLTYQSPEEAKIPASASVAGGVHYEGASYLPSSEQTHALALAGVGVFLLVKILGALILAGLFAGLFPRLAGSLAEAALDRPARSVLLTMLLGFAVLVATPVLLIILAVTFVGLGLAAVVLAAYALLTMLAFVGAGVIAGAFLARYVAKRDELYWRDAVVGMLLLSICAFVPLAGWVLILLLAAFAEGALLRIFYAFAFPRERGDLL